MTQLVHTLSDLRQQTRTWQQQGQTIAFVPTMGALHKGHLSLVRLAHSMADQVVVSIFVNPAQFSKGEDFSKYPRTLEADQQKLASLKPVLIYAPEATELYPHGFATSLHVDGPAIAGLEDRFRPSHFDGVALVVLKLFLQVQPDLAIFGEKDYQQLQVIRKMVRDLDVDVQIVGAPTERESDGLALSSRNIYLTSQERETAPLLYKTLTECANAIRAGQAIDATLHDAVTTLEQHGFALDYLEMRNNDLSKVTAPQDNTRLLVAAKLGQTRLIDNVKV